LNGTYVNSRRVDESVVQHGDEIQVGRFRLVAFFGS
ncbi:MAG: FHA domain-containing protein, partial [Actinomycetota bacterium]